nr:fimbria/pilus periplasmic chaperone [Bacteroidota bacterium]
MSKPLNLATACKSSAAINIRVLLCTIFITLVALPFQSVAQGNLLITPRRVVFEGNKRNQEINLANTGQDTAVYSISFVQYRMTEDGSFEQIEEPDPGQLFADQYIRYFPRTVTLPPNESQVIRMQLRRSADMTDGEYRSHMYFRAVPNERPLGEDPGFEDTTAIGIRLTPIFGITIPVIICIGELDAGVSLSDINLVTSDDGKPVFSITINRIGDKSVYGDLTVDYVSPGGRSTEVGIVRGIAVYTPIPLRRFSMELQQFDDLDFTRGKLVVKYRNQSDTNSELFAETEYLLN